MRPRNPLERKFPGLLLALAVSVGRAGAQAMSPAVETLTNAAQVRSLSAAESAQARPVCLRGVVVDEAYPPGQSVIIADSSSGIYALATAGVFAPYHRGDLLEVKGVTDPGEFAPIVRANSVRKLGTATNPPPRYVTYQELVTGAMDAQWVEIAGVVRKCLEPSPPKPEFWRMWVHVGGGNVTVRLPMPRDARIKEDAEVRLQGVCLYQFNQKRQVLNPVVQVPRGVPVRIEKESPPDPFATPLRPASSLLLFSSEGASGHRIHVRGVVTHSQAGSTVWIRDQSSGLRIQTEQPENLQPGDEIDALGFPTYGFFSPVLEDSIFKKTGSRPPPAPLVFTSFTEAFDHEDDLVSTEARLTEVQPALDEVFFTLNLTGTVFNAALKLSSNRAFHSEWQPGRKVRITGICSVVHEDVRPLMGVWHPQSFQLQLRSPEDLVVLQPPPWWTPRHIIVLLGIGLGGLLLVTGIITLGARRRLNEQSRHRAMAEAEFAAILSERNRLAREIHDTLAQGLVAISVRLRLAKKQAATAPEPLHQHIDAAQQLVHSSLEEARNSIWNMRSQVLETGDLAGALQGILKQMAGGMEVKTDFEITGRPRRLAPMYESHILRVGQEAITNVTRHANASRISVKMEFGEKQFRLVVTDDGSGFDPANPPRSDGGFGLMGMRERATELKGELNIRSAPGQGSEITFSLPLSGD